MVHFRTKQIAPRVTEIRGVIYERMYLVEGHRCAALIDSGSGFGSLRSCIRSLTELPVILLLTHGHQDHAMGAAEFETAYLSPPDLGIFRIHGEERFRRDAVNYSRDAAGVEPEDYIPTADPAHFLPLADGDRFDLGDLHLETLACPGHSPGSVTFLCPELRVLFSGDAFSQATTLIFEEAASVEDYRGTLLAYQPRIAGAADRILEAHGVGELPLGIIDGVIGVCEDILVGRSDRIPYSFRGYHGLIAKARRPHSAARLDGGCGNLIYPEHRLFSAGVSQGPP